MKSNNEIWDIIVKNLKLIFHIVNKKGVPQEHLEDAVHEAIIKVHTYLQRGYLNRGTIGTVIDFAAKRGRVNILRHNGNTPITLPHSVIDIWKEILVWKDGKGAPEKVAQLLANQPWVVNRILSISGWGLYKTSLTYDEIVEEATWMQLYKGESLLIHPTQGAIPDPLLNYDNMSFLDKIDVRSLLSNTYDKALEEANHTEFTLLSRELYLLARRYELEELFLELFEESVGKDSPFCLETALLKDKEDSDNDSRQITPPTLSSIGRTLGITRERARQLENIALSRIRESITY